MHVRCIGCSARYRIKDEYGGRWGRCSQCESRFMLPIPDENRLLEWASSAPWNNLLLFVSNSGARGHSHDVIDKFIRIFEERRWGEENRIRRETGLSQHRPVPSRKQSIWAAAERQRVRRRSLEELRHLAPYAFERFVADLFNAQGYTAKAVGGTADGGIDVQIFDWDGISKWGVAQCKRYDEQNRVSASEIRDFGGAFMLSGAKNGFFFTTGVLTRNAKKTARGFQWLKIYNGPQLVNYIEKLNSQIEQTANAQR